MRHELLGVVPVRIDAGIGAEDHFHTGLDRGAEGLALLAADRALLLQRLFEDPVLLALGEDVVVVVDVHSKSRCHVALRARRLRRRRGLRARSVSTPARIASLMPSVPWACTATRSPSMCASSTRAFISARSNCCAPTASVFDSTPPVPQNLMTSAPYLRSLRTMARNCLGAVRDRNHRRLDRRRESGGVAMAAGRADGIGRRHDARAGDVAAARCPVSSRRHRSSPSPRCVPW